MTIHLHKFTALSVLEFGGVDRHAVNIPGDDRATIRLCGEASSPLAKASHRWFWRLTAGFSAQPYRQLQAAEAVNSLSEIDRDLYLNQPFVGKLKVNGFRSPTMYCVDGFLVVC
ncbi:hypothetical protein B0H14DRAFT_3156146 [Mycena olivaceomarginata]|nr:hypothetical protein B0H14DRAFT_3156146 [Mycena olivaceomarginata]